MTTVAAPARDATGHAGLATRTLAFALDAAVINTVAWFVGAVIALCLSLIGVPDELKKIMAGIGAGCALLWLIGYFVFFWSANGQTPGNRLFGISVREVRTGEPPTARRALLRVFALPLSAIPLCAGFLMILVDPRRRALHDRLVRTVVIYVPAVTARRTVERLPPAAVSGVPQTNGDARLEPIRDPTVHG
jgi:uncharacterized RDD family membrane protein YckC